MLLREALVSYQHTFTTRGCSCSILNCEARKVETKQLFNKFLSKHQISGNMVWVLTENSHTLTVMHNNIVPDMCQTRIPRPTRK